MRTIINSIECRSCQQFCEELGEKLFTFLMTRPGIREVFIRNFFSEILPIALPFERELQNDLRIKLEQLPDFDRSLDAEVSSFVLLQAVLCLFRRAKISQESFDYSAMKTIIRRMIATAFVATDSEYKSE